MDLLKTLLISFGLLFLTSCGGGGSNDSSDTSGNTTYSSQALLGPVVGATVEVYDATDLSVGVLCRTVTEQVDEIDLAGMISLPDDCIHDEGLFLLVVDGGTDIDADDDGLLDETPTPVGGRFHALLTATQLISGAAKATALTEAAYQHVRYLLATGSSQSVILQSLDNSAEHLLKQDLNSDGRINHLDLALWHPRLNRDNFRPSLERLNLLIRDIHQNHSTARHAMALFDAIATLLSELPALADADRVLLDGQRLYVANSTGLTVVDITDPDNPQTIRQITDPDWREVSGMTIAGSWLYLESRSQSSLDETVSLYDISSPENPVQVNADLYHPGGFDLNKFAVQGGYGYAALHRVNNPNDIENLSHEFRLDILDLSSPAQPRLISSLEIDSFGSTMSIQGNRLYLGTGKSPYLESGGLSVVDISNPASPVVLSRMALNEVDELTVIGNRGYAITQTAVTGDSRDRVTLLDLSNDREIVVTGSLDTSHNAWTNKHLIVQSDRGYFTTPDGITIFDFSDVSNPLQIDRISTRDVVNSLAVSGSVVYAAVEQYGLQAFDLSGGGATDSPAIIGRIDIPQVQEMIPFGENRAYALVGQDQQRRIMGLDLSSLLEIGVTTTDMLNDLFQNPVVIDQHLYVTSMFSGLSLFDISNPSAIRLDANYDQSVAEFASAIALSQNRAVLGGGLFANVNNGEMSLIMLNVALSADPVLLDQLAIDYQPFDIAIQDDVVYVVASDNRLVAYRISSANELIELGSMDIPSAFTPMEIIPWGGYAFLSQQHGMVTILDISNPSRPNQLLNVETQGLVADMHLSENLLYIAGQAGSLQVLNVERPDTPVFVGNYRTPSPAQAVMVQSGNVYVAIQDAILISELPVNHVP